MSRAEDPVDRIRRASRLIATAAESWNAGNLAALGKCLSALEESAAELSVAEAEATGHASSLRGISHEILRMKERAGGIERMSGLAAAILSSDAMDTGDSPLYRSGGFEEIPDFSFRATGIQA